MPQSLSQILLHIVFSTKERRPFLRDDAIRAELHRYLGGIVQVNKCHPHIVNGVEDHVHLLCALYRDIPVSTLVRELKRSSSLWIKEKGPDYRNFAWQSGYGAFSIGYSQLADVQHYIAKQGEHHRKVSFQEEFRKFLDRYAVKYQEVYVWD
jgi:putative transposase